MTHLVDVLIDALMLSPLGAIFGLIFVQWNPTKEGQEK